MYVVIAFSRHAAFSHYQCVKRVTRVRRRTGFIDSLPAKKWDPTRLKIMIGLAAIG